MNILKQTTIALAICTLSVAVGRAQDLAAFKIPDAPRAFMFNLGPAPEATLSMNPTNAAGRGIEGLQTILAKGFKTSRRTGVVTLTLLDAVVCRVQRIGEDEAHSSVIIVGEMSMDYPAGTLVLVRGRSIRLADLSEKTFAPPTTFSDVYEGEAAIKKLKETGLEPPEDMDWVKATNRESSQLLR